MLAILVTGARDWTDKQLVYDTLCKYKGQDVMLIHGGCVGLDQIAGEIGFNLGFHIDVSLPDWKKYGRSAGPIRNKLMIDKLIKYQNKQMFAFHDNINLSKGTKNCCVQAYKVGIDAIIITHK